MLFSISGGPDLTLAEVDAAARTVEACADENANIIYGQIVDESMGDAVRITVIATGFKADAFESTRRDYSRKDLFANTSQEPASSVSTPVATPTIQPAVPRTTIPAGARLSDEDYIPDFLKRR